MSQEKLAEAVDISVTHMSHIETGNTKLSLEVFSDIVLALNARADEILYGEREVIGEQAQEEILDLLGRCSGKELCIISDLINAVKSSFDKYGDI
ncbi:MAG: helix-turn-helix domain-containing protein [Ruminiclostridium sp.]